MKIFLASFLQKENFGPSGRIISVTSGNKPSRINVDEIFLPLVPSQIIIDLYYKMKEENNPEAGKYFTDNYAGQLEVFAEEVLETAVQEQKSVMDLLPFQEGDTLCSWERAEFTNYRKTLATCLEKLGYEVITN